MVSVAHCDDLGDSGASDATRTLKASLGARTFLITDCSQFFYVREGFFFLLKIISSFTGKLERGGGVDTDGKRD